jgi:hypothetical protein
MNTLYYGDNLKILRDYIKESRLLPQSPISYSRDVILRLACGVQYFAYRTAEAVESVGFLDHAGAPKVKMVLLRVRVIEDL